MTKKTEAVETNGMDDLVPIDDEEPTAAESAKPAKRNGLEVVNMTTKDLPKDIYYNAGDAEFERCLPRLIGTKSTERLKELAQGRNVRPVGILRQGIYVADEHGCFDPHAAREKRTGNDELPNYKTNVMMRAVLSDVVFDIVVKRARERRISNLSCLYFGVQHALEAGML